MLVILSPAKTLNFEDKAKFDLKSEIEFSKEADKLAKKLSKLSKKKLQDLMKVNNDIADLNYQRYKEWDFPFDNEKSKQAIYAFTGHVFHGLKINEFTKKDIEYTQNHLRILSGLYGVLRPLDMILPYRLEMGTKWQFDGNKNLYDFWDNKINKSLQETIDKQKDKTLVNLASNEYSKVAGLKDLDANIITPVFKDFKNGKYKIISVYAKMARGMMTSFIMKNRIEKAEDLKHFDTEGYFFNDELSSDKEFVFTRG